MRDRSKLEDLYAAHAATVQAYARRRTDHAAADDIVSEVFIAAWRHLDEIPEDPVAWLLGAARKTLANQRRGAERQVALFQRMADHHPASTEDRQPMDGAILRALSRLRPSDRELLLLITWDEVSPGQAAEILDVRASTLSMRLRRARKRLADELHADDLGNATYPAAVMETPR